MVRLISIFAAITFFMLPSAMNAQGTVDLGDINRTSATKIIEVAVASSNSKVETLMKRAFSLHGGYSIASKSYPAFTFRINPVDGLHVTLQIESGRPAKVLYSQTVGGRDLKNATLKAIDLAIVKTSGSEGIFSKKMAFVSDRSGKTEIYVSDLLMASVKQVTNDHTHCVRPNIAPNGRSVLYTSYYRNGFPDIYKIDLASGQRTAFASFKGTNTGATYSPNGNRVAMILSGTGNAELYLSDTRGRNIQRMTRTKGLESDPSWSPNGAELIFTSDSAGKPQLYRMRVSGGEMKRIPTNISGYCAEPDWNPKHSNQVAFTIAQAGQFEVALWDFKTRKSHVITQGVGDALEPMWTADGRHLIYTERTSKYQRLVLLDTLTGKYGYLNDRAWGNASQASCSQY